MRTKIRLGGIRMRLIDADKLIKDIDECDLKDEIVLFSVYEDEEEAINNFIDEVMQDFDEDRGIGSKGYDVASEVISDFWEDACYIGKKSTRILDLYMLAFKLAKQQLDNNE